MAFSTHPYFEFALSDFQQTLDYSATKPQQQSTHLKQGKLPYNKPYSLPLTAVLPINLHADKTVTTSKSNKILQYIQAMQLIFLIKTLVCLTPLKSSHTNLI